VTISSAPPPLPFKHDFAPPYGTLEEIVPGLRRVVANNPGPYTFRGTATFIVGRGDVAVIDPGPKDELHTEAILDALSKTGERVSHILVTHTHPDHSPGTKLLKERTGAQTYAWGGHPHEPGTPEDAFNYPKPVSRETPSSTPDEESSEEHRGDTDFVPDHYLSTGDEVVGETWRTEALHTPGHIANHLCFAFPDLGTDGVVFTGDHVMGWSTSVISPPGGHLADYLQSLALLVERPEQTYVPTHGAPITNGPDLAKGILAHRHFRTAQVLEQLKAGQTLIPQIVEQLYLGLDVRLIPAAGRSILAHMIDLIERGHVIGKAKPSFRVGTASTFTLA
jgi:glyoxylase-like metal-dependent hydrolase (beta-lactamase superfamily II)